jgi:diguanylate cyclase (GGDEF)-like protein
MPNGDIIPDGAWQDADPSVPSIIRELTSVAAAVLDLDSGYRDGNRGFAYLLNRTAPPAIGERVAHWFTQPNFRELLAATDPASGSDGYTGYLSIASPGQCVRTIHAKVYRRGELLLLLGEHDIVELEKLSNTVLTLNEELAQLQRDLVKVNNRLRRDKAEIQRLMLTDPLTGAANRRCFNERCLREIARIQATDGDDDSRLALIMADIDYFKRVNDRCGHAVGDQALIAFTDVLRASTRDDDLVVRLGGEEFCVLLPGIDLDGALRIAERIRAAFTETRVKYVDLALSASFGVTCLRPGESVDDLLRAADQALYKAKAAGRNCVIAAAD